MNIYCYTTSVFPEHLAPERQTILDFNEARDNGVAVASAGPSCKSFAPHSRQITMPVLHHSVFTGWMPFLPPNQQRQSTEGNVTGSKLCFTCWM